jgi:hypothetical protein
LLLLCPKDVAEATSCKVAFELKQKESNELKQKESNELKQKESTERSHQFPPIELTKSVWACMVDTLYEYCRILYDLYPDSAALRAIVAGDGVTCLNGWDAQQQNANVMLANLAHVKSGTPDLAVACCNAIGALEEAAAAGNRPSLCRLVFIVGAVGADDISLESLTRACEPLIASSVAASQLSPDTRWEISLVEVRELSAGEPMRIIQTEDLRAPPPSSALRARHVQLDRARPADAVASMLQRMYHLSRVRVTSIPMKEAGTAKAFDVVLLCPPAANVSFEARPPSPETPLQNTRAVIASPHVRVPPTRRTQRSTRAMQLEGCSEGEMQLKWLHVSRTPKWPATLDELGCRVAQRITPIDVRSETATVAHIPPVPFQRRGQQSAQSAAAAGPGRAGEASCGAGARVADDVPHEACRGQAGIAARRRPRRRRRAGGYTCGGDACAPGA